MRAPPPLPLAVTHSTTDPAKEGARQPSAEHLVATSEKQEKSVVLLLLLNRFQVVFHDGCGSRFLNLNPAGRNVGYYNQMDDWANKCLLEPSLNPHKFPQ